MGAGRMRRLPAPMELTKHSRRRQRNQAGVSRGSCTRFVITQNGANASANGETMSIRTLVVDDEPMARERIVGLLAQEPDVDVVGQCGDGSEAVSAIQKLSPDLVFLDVQMPAGDGFGVLRQIKREQMPMVVFVTAYDEYALQAFDVHALDYLLKPFGRDRLQQSLAHARQQREGRRAGELGRGIMALVDNIAPERKPDRLLVKSGGRVFFVRTDEIE